VAQLYQELEAAGIAFRPKAYLSDEWGCPHEVPVIGIPFYLADPKLCTLEGQMTDIEAETDAEVMMYLRHEAGHAFNYAYRLYAKPGWRRVFGEFSRPYREDYRPAPFSARFVRHIPGWYARKHPDDDFAETFAVWLTPGTAWRERYAETPALAKLEYVNRVTRRYGQQPPIIADEELDIPVQEMTMTLDKWYETCRDANRPSLSLHPALDNDLRSLFPAKRGRPAALALRAKRQQLIQEVNQWTGISRRRAAALVDELLKRIQALGLKVAPKETAGQMMNASVFVSALAMNYLCRGEFVDS